MFTNQPLVVSLNVIQANVVNDWNPEQISKRLAKLGILKVSHERIYQHIFADKLQGGSLYKHLRCQKKYKRRFGGHLLLLLV